MTKDEQYACNRVERARYNNVQPDPKDLEIYNRIHSYSVKVFPTVKKEDNAKAHFTADFWLSGGKRLLKSAENSVRKFCDKEGLKLKVYENYGLLFGRVDFLIEGYGTKRYAEDIKHSFNEWLKQFDR